MKKVILSLCILALCDGTVYAACNGGTMRGGFCVSNVKMNWWSAAAWCQANGSSLATMYDACPDWDGNTGGGNRCGRIIDSSWSNYAWTSTASGSDSAYHVHLSNGLVSNDFGRNDTYSNSYGACCYALCR